MYSFINGLLLDINTFCHKDGLLLQARLIFMIILTIDKTE